MPSTRAGVPAFDPDRATRPDPALLTYYIVVSALTLLAFPVVVWPLVFKYRTLTYRFDEDGVSMSWGLLFQREIYLGYRRIQDIHVTRNLVHRWLGLAAVAVQTASGSAGAEMTIEGIRDPEGLRDFLYARMRGARDEASGPTDAGTVAAGGGVRPADDALLLLCEIRDELRRLRPPAQEPRP
jgi:uncharacterized protein